MSQIRLEDYLAVFGEKGRGGLGAAPTATFTTVFRPRVLGTDYRPPDDSAYVERLPEAPAPALPGPTEPPVVETAQGFAWWWLVIAFAGGYGLAKMR